MSALLTAVRNLAATRQSKADIDAQIKAAREKFDAEHAEILAAQKQYAEQERTEAEQVRALALVAYKETGAKKPAEGVEIKVGKVYTYDAEKALAWAKETKMALVPESLDVKAFEKIAKATALPFVVVTEEPKATIATDLAAAVGVEAPF